MDEFNYSLWEEEEELPARSRLYSLPMEECGNRAQESLLDYCHRLAHAHRVKVIELLRAEVIPHTQIRGAMNSNRFSEEYAKTINGYGKYAVQIAEVLEELTGQASLACGTFAHWRPILDPKGNGLLNHIRQWCPSCLAEAHEGGWPVTFPLIWAVANITHCAIHLTRLRQTCRYHDNRHRRHAHG